MADHEEEENEIILCEPDRQMTDQGFGLRACVLAIAVAPLIYLIASIAAAWIGKDLKLDDRILTACLAGWATILWWGFKKKS
ncbi:MAG: hypothetical protein K2W95_00775 [Candidatus Obscuribacterales bacterium]|nr:hypothetical protein [Candidatus Obscuribacterales bacterium]